MRAANPVGFRVIAAYGRPLRRVDRFVPAGRHLGSEPRRRLRRCHFVATPPGSLYDGPFERQLAPAPCPNAAGDCFIGCVHRTGLDVADACVGGALGCIPHGWRRRSRSPASRRGLGCRLRPGKDRGRGSKAAVTIAIARSRGCRLPRRSTMAAGGGSPPRPPPGHHADRMQLFAGRPRAMPPRCSRHRARSMPTAFAISREVPAGKTSDRQKDGAASRGMEARRVSMQAGEGVPGACRVRDTGRYDVERGAGASVSRNFHPTGVGFRPTARGLRGR